MAAPGDGFIEGFIEQDAHGCITGWSDESGHLFGWTSGDAIGMRSHALIPERNRARHDRLILGFLAEHERRIQRLEITAIGKDGHEFRAEFHSAIEDRDGDRFIITLVRAITPDARADAAFRQSARFRTILNQIEDGCSVVDLRGNYLYVNDAFCRIFGFTKEQVLGRNYRDSQNPERQARTFEIFNRVFTTGQPEMAYAYQVSATQFIEQSISLERGADGRAVAFISIYRDCTARQLAEDQLARAKEAAEAANRAKSEFLANMSHEIRTPMNGIIGMAELALDTTLTPQQADYVETIRSQADSLLTIVNDILDFSKIESRRIEIEHVPFLLAEVVAAVVKPLAIRAREKGVAFSSDVASDVPAYLAGDPVRVKQILTNLLANAIKFTARGSVTLTVTLDARDGDGVTIHFRAADTGIGIPADKLTTIFEPFRQVDGSTTRRFGGTGLGLAISATLVELMGGRLWAESRPGAGSTFHVVAPFTAAQPPAVADERARTARAAAAPVRPAHVLVAEDNIVNQRVAAGLLTRRGHRVTVVASGREALVALQRDAFDLILMDVQMPDMDGFEATAAIRARERETGGHIRIVAMTAHAMTGDRDRCLAAGMDGYLSKPIDQRSLFDAVEQ
jgi:two-component system, sensor histidine kinase and response regulator